MQVTTLPLLLLKPLFFNIDLRAAQQLLKLDYVSRSAQIVSRLQTELETSKHFTPDFTSQVNFLGPCQDPCSYVVAHTQLYTHTD